MGSYTQFSPRTIFTEREKLWNPSKTLEIINPDNSCLTCIGYAPSQGRRCRNPIRADNRTFITTTLDEIAYLPSDSPAVISRLRAIVGRALCVRYHQDQAETVLMKWQRKVQLLDPQSGERTPAKPVRSSRLQDPAQDQRMEDLQDQLKEMRDGLAKLQEEINSQRHQSQEYKGQEERAAKHRQEEERRQRRIEERIQQAMRKERARLEEERLEKERLEKERALIIPFMRERLLRACLMRERLEKEHLEKERLEKERLEKERLEKERLEKECLEKERLAKERLEKERLEKERLEKERLEKERLEKERLEKERLEKEKRDDEEKHRRKSEGAAANERIRQRAQKIREEREREKREKEQKEREEWTQLWATYQERWAQFRASASDSREGRFRDAFPWPVKSGSYRDTNYSNVKEFFQQAVSSNKDIRMLLKKESLKWHPDKRCSWLRDAQLSDVDKMMVEMICRVVTELIDASAGKSSEFVG